jgi:hypothetical protein
LGDVLTFNPNVIKIAVGCDGIFFTQYFFPELLLPISIIPPEVDLIGPPTPITSCANL